MPWAIVALGAILRLLLLDMKPPHFDEGINGWFVDQMVKNGFFRYDPTNYHGPLHFYILFLSQTLLGRNLWALRLPVVFVSIFCVHLTLKFEPFVGRNVSRLAALAMAVSPGFVFYGRYSIHEVWLQLFSMLFILGLLGLWQRGTAKYLWCAGMGLAGMILSKETYIIHVGCAVIAVFVTWISHLINRAPDAKPAPQTWTVLDLALVLVASAAALIFFYSGTFLNWEGVKGLYQTFDAWFKTGHNGNGHEKPWNYWLELVLRYEWPVLIGLFLCLACQFFKNVVIRYLAIYGVGVFAAYSIIHYKTPWCIISMVWPLLFVFAAGAASGKVPRKAFDLVGFAVIGFGLGAVASYLVQPTSVRTACSFPAYMGEAIKMTLAASSGSSVCGGSGGRFFWSTVVGALLGGGLGLVISGAQLFKISDEMMRVMQRAATGLALVVSLALAISLNYFRCTTDTEPYVYVQTYNDVYKLTRPLLRLAKRDPTYYQLVGHLIRSSTYPFPWVLGDFTRVGYYEHDNLPDKVDADFLLVQQDKIEEVESKLHDAYYTEPLTIRPYQDPSKLYLSAKVFERFYKGQVPQFAGKSARP
jgi:uncharacterized protein (TIGR03663 family)